MTCHILAHAQTIRKLCVHTCGSESCEGKTRGKQTTSVTARHGHLWPVDPLAVSGGLETFELVWDCLRRPGEKQIPPTPSDRSMKSKVQTPPDETCTLHVPLATQGRGSQCWCDLCLVALLTTGVYLQQVFAKHIFKVCTSTPDEKDRQGRIVYRGCEGGPALVIFLFVLFFF